LLGPEPGISLTNMKEVGRLAERHGLSEEWKRFKRRFLDG
jgi:hypothetical protein